jgi:hypothetical protein
LFVATLPCAAQIEAFDIPMDAGGSLRVAFTEVAEAQFSTLPALSFRVIDNSRAPWQELSLDFEIGAICGNQIEIWNVSVAVQPGNRRYTQRIPNARPLAGCSVEVIRGHSVASKVGNALTIPEVANARMQRLAAEQAERDRLEAARKARVAAEAMEAAKVRATCRAVYRSTSDKRVRDLTVKEEQQVRACQALELYSPD